MFCWLLAVALPVGAAGLESREVAFQSAGYRLVGTLSVPGGPALAAVLILPGSGPTDRNGLSRVAPSMPPIYRQWAERLGEAGIGALRHDKRFLTHPDVDMPSFDQEAQIADSLSAVGFLRSTPEFASKPIFIAGHSEGGTLAPIVAQRAGVAGVAVVNTVQFAADELVVAQLAAMKMPSDQLDEVKRFFAQIKDGSFPRGGLLLGVGANYWTQWIKYSAGSRATLSRLSMPLLLIQSLDDETLPGGTLGRNVATLRAVASANRNAQLHELQGHDHQGMLSGSREPSGEFMRILSEWLRSEARATASPVPASPSAPGTRD
jgi:pimeloyl-ACP methyl ester carboxylesterase